MNDSLPAGPSEPPIVQTLWWLVRPISFMESCRRRYGDAFSVRFLGFEKPTVFLSDPDAIRALYTEPAHGLPPGRVVSLSPVLGADSVLLLEGREHIARRRLMLPPFHGERMRSYESTVREVTEREIAGWPVGRPFALHRHMQAITLEVVLRAVFGVVDQARRARLRELLPQLLGQNSSILLQLRVLLSRRAERGDPLARLRVLLDQIDALLFSEIVERRADPTLTDREDILSLLIAAHFEDGTQMGDRELRDQLMTLLLAGHETTATALAWTIDLLLRNPVSLARLTAEIDRDDGEESYLRAVITESLRLRPVVPLAGRRLSTEMNSDGLRLPAGTDATPAIWLTHTRPDIYPDPRSFHPERFLDGASSPPSYGWIPFGGGIRRCLGASFAEMEMRIVLRAILSGCTLRPEGRRAERIARRNVTFSPRRGTRVRVQRRVPAAASAVPVSLSQSAAARS